MSHQKMYRAVVAYVRLMAFALAQEAKKVSPTKTTADARAIESDARMRHTKLTLPCFRQRIGPRALEVFLWAA